jgi:hypothetical protein
MHKTPACMPKAIMSPCIATCAPHRQSGVVCELHLRGLQQTASGVMLVMLGPTTLFSWHSSAAFIVFGSSTWQHKAPAAVVQHAHLHMPLLTPSTLARTQNLCL